MTGPSEKSPSLTPEPLESNEAEGQIVVRGDWIDPLNRIEVEVGQKER